MIQLHYYPSTAAMVPHIVLEEMGIDYERIFVDRAAGEHKRADYLALNPKETLNKSTDHTSRPLM